MALLTSSTMGQMVPLVLNLLFFKVWTLWTQGVQGVLQDKSTKVKYWQRTLSQLLLAYKRSASSLRRLLITLTWKINEKVSKIVDV